VSKGQEKRRVTTPGVLRKRPRVGGIQIVKKESLFPSKEKRRGQIKNSQNRTQRGGSLQPNERSNKDTGREKRYGVGMATILVATGRGPSKEDRLENHS